MKILLLLLFIIYVGCANSQQENKMTSFDDEVITSEKFSTFYDNFYNDTIFQNERILKPLKGTVKFWSDDVIIEESWENKEIIVTPREEYLEAYNKLKTDITVNDTIAVEKYWIEQSGFFIKKVYKMQTGRWYLYSYDISNL